VKKWVCSICGRVYDPEKEHPAGEAEGAARCGWLDEQGELVEGFTCGTCGAARELFREHA